MTPVVPSLTLRSGAKMPALGLGTWKIAAGDTTAAVLSALRCGYRLLDCAPVYGNQPQVGAAIQQALDEGTLRSRDELFVTSKLMTQTLEPTDFEAAVRDLARRAGRGLPGSRAAAVAGAAEGADRRAVVRDGGARRRRPRAAHRRQQLQRQKAGGTDGRVRRHASRGGDATSALLPRMITASSASAGIPPAVNQVECGAHFRQERLLRWCVTRGVVVQAYGPLGSGDQFSSDGMGREAGRSRRSSRRYKRCKGHRHDASPGVAALERGTGNVCVIPKSANPGRQLENLRAVAGDTALPGARRRDRFLRGAVPVTARVFSHGPEQAVQDSGGPVGRGRGVHGGAGVRATGGVRVALEDGRAAALSS